MTEERHKVATMTEYGRKSQHLFVCSLILLTVKHLHEAEQNEVLKMHCNAKKNDKIADVYSMSISGQI